MHYTLRFPGAIDHRLQPSERGAKAAPKRGDHSETKHYWGFSIRFADKQRSLALRP